MLCSFSIEIFDIVNIVLPSSSQIERWIEEILKRIPWTRIFVAPLGWRKFMKSGSIESFSFLCSISIFGGIARQGSKIRFKLMQPLNAWGSQQIRNISRINFFKKKSPFLVEFFYLFLFLCFYLFLLLLLLFWKKKQKQISLQIQI